MSYTKNLISFRNLAYIPFFFVFLPAFSLVVGTKPIVVFFIAVTLFFIVMFFLKPKKSFRLLKTLYKKTPYKYFLFFAIWVVISGFFLVILGKYSISNYIYYMILFLLINMSLPLILPGIMIKNEDSLKVFIKILISFIYTVLVLGILNFIGTKFDIGFINNFFAFIVNDRTIDGGSTSITYGTKVYSVFSEPGWFGGFIVFFLPILYSLSKSKYKLYSNRFLNLVIKRSIIWLAMLDIILTRSPIWLLVFFSVYGLLMLQNFKKFIYKNKIKLLFVFIILFAAIWTVILIIGNNLKTEDESNKYISRIVVTIESLKTQDYEKFAEQEESLATRITSYINIMRIFADYPIAGIGLGNTKFHIIEKFDTSPVPLTFENYICLMKSAKTGKMRYNEALLYQLLAETGLVGCLLYYCFIFNLYKRLSVCQKISNGIKSDLISGLKNSLLILFFVFSIYDIGLTFVYVWLLLGVAQAVILITSEGIADYRMLSNKKVKLNKL